MPTTMSLKNQLINLVTEFGLEEVIASLGEILRASEKAYAVESPVKSE